MTEKAYFWLCCGTEITGKPTTVFDWNEDGTPHSSEERCKCGQGHIFRMDGGLLDLGLVRDDQLNDANDFQVFPQIVI